jgi:SulP family sulfate permease
MHKLVMLDASGLDALEQLHATLQRQGIGLVLANVNAQPLEKIRRAGFEQTIGADNVVPNLAAAWGDEERAGPAA